MTQTQNPNDTCIKQQGQGVWDFLHNIAWKCAAVWLCTYCPIVHKWVKRQRGKYKRSSSKQPSRVKGRVPVSSSLTREKIPLRCVTQSHSHTDSAHVYMCTSSFYGVWCQKPKKVELHIYTCALSLLYAQSRSAHNVHINRYKACTYVNCLHFVQADG